VRSFEGTPLGKRERKAIEDAVRMLKSQYGVEKVILFGSKARGDSDEYSDIDLLIVGSGPFHWKEEKAMVEALFDIGMEYDVIFSPLFASNEEWEGGLFTEFPIYQEIVTDGAIVA